MRTKPLSIQNPPRPGYEVVDKKVREANEYLKNADLSLIYETLEKNKAKH